MPTRKSTLRRLGATLVLCALSASGQAAEWSDTALSVRYGTKFAEPYDNNANGSRKDIAKTIVGLTHASGYKYGGNFFNVDILQSDSKDPGNGTAGASGAQEVYVVYRNTFDMGKISGTPIKFGPVRGLGITAGFDLNAKNDGYASKKRLLVLGPTLMFDVPGFLNLSLLALKESNRPNGILSRYSYKTHGAAELDWGLPVASLPLSFNGYAVVIASKGKNEFGGDTATETHIDMSLMLDIGAVAGMGAGTFKIGVEYEYWKNKFGNPTTTPGAGPGATARTPMIRGEYHF